MPSRPQTNRSEGDFLRLVAQLYGDNPIRVEWADSLVSDLAKSRIKLSISTARSYVYGMRRPSAKIFDAVERLRDRRLNGADPEVPQHIQAEIDSLNTRRLIRVVSVDKRFRSREKKYQEIAEAARQAGDKLSQYKDCVDAMCRTCAGAEGVCMVLDCPLRSLSPMPLGYGAKTLAEAEGNSNV